MPEIKNLKKLANRILKAIKGKERIVIFGDADLDGTVAAIILKEIIVNLGGESPLVYFSDRKQEEPGLNETGLNFLKDRAPALLMVVDCGISNFKEAILAKKLGFEVAMVEHHEILGKLPKASIIVDPKQEKKTKKNEWFFDLATAGLALKLSEIMLGKNLSGNLKEDFFGLAALATVSDMVSETGENQKIISEGLINLENSWRPAIKCLFKFGIGKNCFSTREIVQKAITIINITDKEGGPSGQSELYLFLNSRTPEEAKLRFEMFLQKGSERQIKIEKINEEYKRKISLKNDKVIIFEGDAEISQPLLGAIASRLCLFFEKPTFIYKKTEKENIGHFRMPPGFSGIKALASCTKLLRRYGGHAAAGGFYFDEKNKERIKQRLIKYFLKNR